MSRFDTFVAFLNGSAGAASPATTNAPVRAGWQELEERAGGRATATRRGTDAAEGR
jgi:hypothetical protein